MTIYVNFDIIISAFSSGQLEKYIHKRSSCRMLNETAKLPEKKAATVRSIVAHLQVTPSNTGAQQFMDTFQNSESNPKTHIFLEIDKLVNEFFNLKPTPSEIEVFVSTVDDYITKEQKETAIKTLKASYSNPHSSKEEIVSVALQRIKRSNGSLMNMDHIPVPFETSCTTLLISLAEYVGILSKLKNSPLSQEEISFLLETMKIQNPKLTAIPNEQTAALSAIDSSGINSIELFLPTLHLETARLNYEFLNNSYFPKLFYSCKYTLKKNNMEVAFFNTLWSDLENIFQYEGSSQFFKFFSRERIEKSIVGNFGFLQISTRSPRLVEKKVLNDLATWNSTKKFSLYSSETHRKILVYEIGHIILKNLSDGKTYEPIRQYMVLDKSSNRFFLRYGIFSEKFATISRVYQDFIVDHYFSLKNLKKANPYLGKANINVNVPIRIESTISEIFSETPSIDIFSLSDRIKENNINF